MWKKALAWRGKGLNIAGMAKQGIVPSMQYGAACHGSTAELLKGCWAAVSTSLGAGPGRAAVLAEAMQAAEDYAIVVLAPVKTWLHEAWERPECKNKMEMAWNAQRA